ncbi:MAG: MBOAT family protein [Eubacterium sp.]|nr:MBOAT family protein [Eubacterium sp.]
MLFSSITFLYYFLPLVFILYFIVPKSWKNIVLLLSSLFFYAWGEPKYVILMLVSIGFGYLFGLLIEKHRSRSLAKLWTAISVAISLSFLVYFKYADFFIANFNRAFGTDSSLLAIVLPIGISFYTFQIISYTIDVYRGEAAQKNPLQLATYIAMFPQLIAGPIVRYSSIADQLKHRTHSLEKVTAGITRFLLGLGKKVLIANQLGELCAAFGASTETSVLFYWIYALAFALQIYFDFSGYSDMAIGLGKIFGFQFAENFNYPFISRSISEFWRRWHISLGSWFRDYVYIPLGGNRVALPRWIFNVFFVWFLTGFWHGASWNFVIWGLFYAVFLVLEKAFLGKLLEKCPTLGHIYVIFLILISFTIFNADNMQTVLQNLAGMFGAAYSPAYLSVVPTNPPLVSAETLYYLQSYGVILIAAIIGSTPVVKMAAAKLPEKARTILTPIVLVALLLVITGYLVDGSFNPFLYFRF